MASGHVNRTSRPNTWQHRPSLRREDSSCQPGAVHTWLNAVRLRRGYAKYLACKVIMNTGIRRKELEALVVAQWPDADAITRVQRRGLYSVPMRLTETKGGRPRVI